MLLHGLADTHDLWRHQLGPLSRRHRLIAVDLRGHGRSRYDGSDYSLEDAADDVRSTMAEAGIERAVVIGLSMGGGVAQMLALTHPECVRALVLVSTSSEFPMATRERFLTRAAHAEAEGMAAVVDATVPRWFTPAFADAHPEEVERTRRSVLDIDPRAFAAASRANAIRDLTRQLRSITCPVAFVGGADDPARPNRALEIYRRELPDLRTAEILDGASHLVPVEAPDRFNDLVLRFLAELEPDTKET